MPGEINIDTTNETVTVSFTDRASEDTSAPDGAQVTFTSDNEAVATVAPSPDNPLVGQVSPLTEGSVNIGATFNGTALESDGATPIADPSPVLLQVDPGAAVGSRLTPAV